MKGIHLLVHAAVTNRVSRRRALRLGGARIVVLPALRLLARDALDAAQGDGA